MTNSSVDFDGFRNKYGVEYNPVAHGTPPDFGGRAINVPGKGDLPIVMNSKIQHVACAHATKFNTPADFVRAYDEAIKIPFFKQFATDPSKLSLRIEDLRASDVFGSNFAQRLKGYDANGIPTVFGPDTKIFAVFRKDANGVISLITMYPNP